MLQEVVSISAEKAQQFWNSVEPLRTKGFTVANTIGCDGISVQAFYRQADSSISCDTWNPDPASPVGMFIYLIYDLAWEVLREEASLDRLEHLHGYLKHELPVRMIDGDVRCLRIFDRLASNDENDLRQALGSLPMAEPMVVDMTNFEGMGTLLYPIFIQFASTHRHIAWSVSSAAKHHLEAMALSSPHVFETREDAVKWLNDYSKNLG